MNEIHSKSFMGSGISFPPRVNPQSGRFVMSIHEENVHESVRILLQTFAGERVMRPSFGAVAENVLFSDLNAQTLTNLEQSVRMSLEENEPRIADVEVKTSRKNKGELDVEISYIVRTTNNLFSKVYPFYVLEGAGL